MATYTVTTGEGGELTAGLTLDEARAFARESADERGETVYVAGLGLHTDGVERDSDEDIGEAVEPVPLSERLAEYVAALAEETGEDAATIIRDMAHSHPAAERAAVSIGAQAVAVAAWAEGKHYAPAEQ